MEVQRSPTLPYAAMRACLLRLVVLLFTASQESRLVNGLGALQHYRYHVDVVRSLKTQLHTEEESTTHAMTDRLFCDILGHCKR